MSVNRRDDESFSYSSRALFCNESKKNVCVRVSPFLDVGVLFDEDMDHRARTWKSNKRFIVNPSAPIATSLQIIYISQEDRKAVVVYRA